MNWQHLQAFVWLRWRLLKNQWRRGGARQCRADDDRVRRVRWSRRSRYSSAVSCWAIADSQGHADASHVCWDGLSSPFCSSGASACVTELQRTEPLSLSKFLHLPVSVNGAFLINYVSSLLRLSLIVFVPIMLGFSLALGVDQGIVAAAGPAAALAAFLLMVTALTYQFQGWLASLMSNPRRRRTVIVVTTMIFVLDRSVAEPAELLRPVGRRSGGSIGRRHWPTELAKLDRDVQIAGRSMPRVRMRRQQEVIEKHKARPRAGRPRELCNDGTQTARLVNMVLPVGWLPLGVMAAAEGHAMPSILGMLGMTLIGAGQSLAGVPHDDRTVSGAVVPTRKPGRRPPPRSQYDCAVGKPRTCCSKRVFPACRNRFPQSRSAGLRRWCGRPRRR